MSDELVAVGRIGRPRGIRGETFVEPWSDDPEARFAVGSVMTTEPAAAGPLTVAAMSINGGTLVVRFAESESRESAEALRGTRLLVVAGDRTPLADPDDFYDTDLIGLAAADPAGTGLGTVADVLHAGGADYLVLHRDGAEHAGREYLVPFVRAIVPEVDIAARRVVIDPPDGLFDI